MKLRELITGQVLLREGDPPGPIYIVCAGRLRVYRRDYSADHERHTDLAWLSTGDVIGELGPILARPRSATVQALEPAKVLEILPDELPRLAQQHQPLVRVITNALRERAGLPSAELSKLAARVGLELPASFSRDANAHDADSGGPLVPSHDARVVYPKLVTCPACQTEFHALVPRARKDVPSHRESDFHNLYQTAFNPYDYEVWVCPNDLYAALQVDFASLSERHVAGVAATVAGVLETWQGERPDFNADRTLGLRERSLELAMALYVLRGLAPTRLAAIAHRMAWCKRERGAAEQERQWLERALEYYTKAFESTNLGDAKEELRIQYLSGELTLRLGDPARAVTWFSDALRHPGLRDNLTWERKLREQLTVARERMTAEAAA